MHIFFVVLAGISILMTSLQDLYSIERAAWATVLSIVLFLVGIILIIKPNYFFTESEPLSRRLQGVMFILMSIMSFTMAWQLYPA